MPEKFAQALQRWCLAALEEWHQTWAQFNHSQVTLEYSFSVSKAGIKSQSEAISLNLKPPVLAEAC
jgi:hypothetical protein